MLKFDRYGYNDEHQVYESRYYANEAAKCLSIPVVIKAEKIDDQICYALWSRHSLKFTIEGDEMS